jgi:hypothetical protein
MVEPSAQSFIKRNFNNALVIIERPVDFKTGIGFAQIMDLFILDKLETFG